MRILKSIKQFICCLFIGCSFYTTNAQVGCQFTKSAKTQAPIYYNLENLRSDTFNILKYTINLEIGNSSNKLISGNTEILYVPKMNGVAFIRFDLLKLTIDSIKENATNLLYAYNDTVVRINFNSVKNITDTSVLVIYYKGLPQLDATGWGGFYFDNSQGAEYAYNLGVGFGANPHNYGRVWFPCFDNFVERSKYEFNITSDTARRAYCNGQLISDVVNVNKRTRKWILNEEIPTYLASISLAKYSQVNWTVNTLTGLKPITLAAFSADTSTMKVGFVNLKNCIAAFENYFGPYRWNRFGYCLVPFNSGAMEHATNITYPKLFAGNINYEAELMAHELSHHWWGNLITCETQEDMWINEGFATFSGYMFTEWQYGKTAYLNKVKTVHDDLLHFLHKNEGGFRAVSGMPHNLTYSDHVYKKGADIAHTMRGYMGDSAFFAGIKYTMQQNAYKSVNSNEFRNSMQTGSGKNLTQFFNDWVFSAGWSHFSIDSVRYVSNNSAGVDAIVSLKQKLYGASSLHTNVPLELSFFKNDWSRVIRTVVLSGASQTFTINIPTNAVYCALNYDSKINDASSHEVKVIKSIGVVNYALAKVTLQIQNKGMDSSLIRIIHNYVKPDPFFNNPKNHKLSNQHYWKVEGILSSGFISKAKFTYDGSKGTTGANVYMDTLLTSINADSLKIFFRENVSQDWTIVKDATKTMMTLRGGSFTVDTLKVGEYSFGNFGDSAVLRVKKNDRETLEVKIYPNPVKQKFIVELMQTSQKEYTLTMLNVEGKVVLITTINNSTTIDVGHLSKGTYVIKLQSAGKEIYSQKVVLD